MIQFVASGSPRVVSRAIEEYAAGQRTVNAIVVPWESDRVTLTMSVTAVGGEGWAIEHTNLGTIRLTDLGNEHTEVTVSPDSPSQADGEKRATLFNRFAQAIHSRFTAAP
jgi:hypothetical protein